MQDAFLPLKGFLESHLASLENAVAIRKKLGRIILRGERGTLNQPKPKGRKSQGGQDALAVGSKFCAAVSKSPS
jgi:hypothetical protein